MSRSTTNLLIVFCLLVSACGGDDATAATPTTSTTVAPTTTTSTLPPTTTTTIVPLEVGDAPADLVDEIEAFYLYATAGSDDLPAAPDALIDSITPSESDYPTVGSATTAMFLGEAIAVVEMGSDLFLAVDDGKGWSIVGGEWTSIDVPAYFGQGPRHVAVVGSDARPGQSIDNHHADSIHFIALDGNGDGAVVGLPRDSFVPLPGHGNRKITASLAVGGPELMMESFLELTGLPIEGYVLTGFEGFEAMLESVLGGVEVEVPFAINDRWAHVALAAGEQLLSGAEALGFARARKTTGGDLVRSGHQGVILIGAAEMVAAMGYSAIPGLLEASEEHLLTDLSPEQLLTFSAMAISADLDSMPNVVAQGRVGTAGGASVVFLNDSVSELWDDLADGRLDD